MAKTSSKNNIYNYTGLTPDTNIFNNEEINKKYDNVSSMLNNTLNTIKQNIFKSTPSTTGTSEATTDADVYNLFRSYYPTYEASSYTSGGGGGMIDISNILRSLDDAATAKKAIAQQTYNTKREDLLDSLKKFQEQNARDVKNQQRTYLSNQAAIENAIAQANRQNRISAASRGLGGSGLQQLAQLQNLLSQGQTISDIANANQLTMDDLRRALAEEIEKERKGQERALADLNNTLMDIESTVGLNKANIEYQAREAAANRVANAKNIAAQIEAQNQEYNTAALEKANKFNARLSNIQKQYDNALTAANSSKKLKEAKANYESSLADLLEEYGISASNPVYNNTYDYSSNIYDTAYNNATRIEDLLKFGNTSTTFPGLQGIQDYSDLKKRLKAGDLYNYNGKY